MEDEGQAQAQVQVQVLVDTKQVLIDMSAQMDSLKR